MGDSLHTRADVRHWNARFVLESRLQPVFEQDRLKPGLQHRNECASVSLNSRVRCADIGVVAKARAEIPSRRDWGEKEKVENPDKRGEIVLAISTREVRIRC
jgi:hypothetical protein